ncbi:MAG: PepSY domain-containing protein [Comamonadaceae bacterium]|nr:PepSY domain-containing protein [Pseudomonadota bacterium]MBS0495911.1 PepSY domain-containing protein [Pseudomonadota bacterium]MBS0609949.1 PepSY domain-containing protein [Pseudomonadota bacterium]MDE2413281.1 PepSY domain-containing protein [Comamonadaceae bacterium]
MTIHTTSLAALAAVLATSGALAYAAASAEGNDALAAAAAPVSLTQAIAAAEQHANGKATRAEYEHSRKGAYYEVEVVQGQQVWDVRVDPQKGTVLTVALDKADKSDRHDKDD